MTTPADIVEPTAEDFESLLQNLPRLYAAGAHDRLERLRQHARDQAEARRRPRFLFMPMPMTMPEAGNKWVIGPPVATVGGHRFYESKLIGLALAHHVITRNEPVPYTCPQLLAAAPRRRTAGSWRDDASCNALGAAARWVLAESGCTEVATAIESIVAGKVSLSYRPAPDAPTIITRRK